jgi:hypothetical protein
LAFNRIQNVPRPPKIPPWELMARATKYEPQVGASALGWRSLRMMYFLFIYYYC